MPTATFTGYYPHEPSGMGGPWLDAHGHPLVVGSAAVNPTNPLLPQYTIVQIASLAGRGAGPNKDLFLINDTGPRVGSNQIDIMNRGLLNYRAPGEFQVVGHGMNDWRALTQGSVASPGEFTDNPFADPSWQIPDAPPMSLADLASVLTGQISPSFDFHVPDEGIDWSQVSSPWTADLSSLGWPQWEPSNQTQSLNLAQLFGDTMGSAGGRPMPTIDFSSLVPPAGSFQFNNPAPANEAFNPMDWFGAMSPFPHQTGTISAAGQASVGGQYSNPAAGGEAFNPVDWFGAMSPFPQQTGTVSAAGAWSGWDPGSMSIGGNDIANFPIINIGNDLPAAPGEMSSPGEITDNPAADPSWQQYASGESAGEITDNPFADPSWLPSFNQPSGPQTATPRAPVDLNNQSAGIPGRPEITWNDLINAPHTGEVFRSQITDPATGRVAFFDPAAGGYVLSNYSATGQFAAGGPFSGLTTGHGGVGPQFSAGVFTGQFNGPDSSQASYLSHGGVDPSSSSSPGPLERLYSLGEGGRNVKQGMSIEDYYDTLPTPAARTPAEIAALLASVGAGRLVGHKSFQIHRQPSALDLPPGFWAAPTNIIPFPTQIADPALLALAGGTNE
jgi:hypothetical protein